MEFSKLLSQYIESYNLTISEISKVSRLSKSTVSRFISGNSKPSFKNSNLESLSKAIAELSNNKKSGEMPGISYSQVYESFLRTLPNYSIDFQSVVNNLNLLMETLDINAHELSIYMNFDASYLSRIRSGQRRPSDISKFCSDVASYIAKHYCGKNSDVLRHLIDCKIDAVETPSACYETVFNWFTETEMTDSDIMQKFLSKLNKFELNKYIRTLSFDDPNETAADIEPVDFDSKKYYGIPDFMTAEIDWLKTVMLSDSTEPLFIYSDMPIEKLSENQDFLKKWIYGIALIMKKGLRLNIVHNVERSFIEMILGIENWIPLYMTGFVSPYYLKGYKAKYFHNFLHYSDSAVLSGEAIKGHYKDGCYYFSRIPEDIEYYRKKANALIGIATPLMEIYRRENFTAYNTFFTQNYMCGNDSIRNILSVPPLYTISQELLERILMHSSVNDEEKRLILNAALQCKERFEMTKCSITDELSQMSKEEFEQYPVSLHMNDLFYENPITYTYEEYCEHISLTQKYAQMHENYQCFINYNNPFRNIQIRMALGKFVIISKNNSPVIHFVIKHDKLREAIEKMIIPNQ